MSKRRFEIVHNIASPYRLHMFGEMRRQLAERGIDFHVNFMSDMSRGLAGSAAGAASGAAAAGSAAVTHCSTHISAASPRRVPSLTMRV